MTSKRDYVAIADMVRNTPMPQDSRDELTDRMIVFFEQTNVHFDAVRFRDACGASRAS